MNKSQHVFTIGHSTQSFGSFLGLLKRHDITAITDVRSVPYSRHAPHFCIHDLKDSLRNAGVFYVFLGKELGARSDDNSCYIENVVSYERLAQAAGFQHGIQRVIDGSWQHRIALMCSERDPTECHRTILVSKILTERDVKVSHILGNGEIESHQDTMLRVADLVGLPRYDFFMSREDIIANAYERREQQIAYRRKG